MCARSEVSGSTAVGVTFRAGTRGIQSSIQLATTQQRENLNLIPLKTGRTSLAFAWAGSRPMCAYLRPPLGSSSEEKVPLQTLPKEWLGLSLPSSHSDAGSRFFLLPNSFLKGWNLPAFFLSAGYKTERRRAEGRGGSARLASRHRRSTFKGRTRSKSKSAARSSLKGACNGNAGLQLAVDASYWHSKCKSIKTPALGSKDLLGGVSVAKHLDEVKG